MSEDELKQIEYELENLEEVDSWDNGISYSDFDYNFISKSRERIAALVKIVKEQNKLIKSFGKYQKEHWMKFKWMYENKRDSYEVE